MKKKKYHFRMVVALLLICICLAFVLEKAAEASGVVKVVDQVNDLKDEQGYIRYFANYYLDMENTERLDFAPEMLNNLANIQMNTIRNFVMITSMLFYHALDFNLANYFGTEIDTIQSAMRSSFLEPLFLIGFSGSAIIIIKRMLKRDMIGMYGQILKVLGILVLSLFVVRESSTVIAKTTELTSSIGAEILSGDGTVSDYAARTAGSIWYNLAHLPWEYAEFGADEYGSEQVISILTLEKNDTARKDIVEKWQGNAFKMERAGERVAFLILYMVPLFIKCVIYIVMGGMLLLYQVLAVFYVLLAPFVLIIAMLPSYEHIISAWIRRFVEIQINALVMYFVVGLLFKVDEVLISNVGKEWGWLVVLTAQVILYVGVFIKRNEVLGAISKLGITTPRTEVNKGVNSVKAMAIQSVMAARSIGMKAAVAKNGTTTAAITKNKNAETQVDKKVERPITTKENTTYYSQEPNSHYTNSHSTSSKAHRERLRPTRMEFVERQIILEFEPSERHREEEYYSEEAPIHRPRMDSQEIVDGKYKEMPTNVTEKKEKKQQNLIAPPIKGEERTLPEKASETNTKTMIEKKVETVNVSVPVSTSSKMKKVDAKDERNPRMVKTLRPVKAPRLATERIKIVSQYPKLTTEGVQEQIRPNLGQI